MTATEKEFDSSEKTTAPNRKEYWAYRVVQLWNACSAKDQKIAARILELMARDNQGECKWD